MEQRNVKQQFISAMSNMLHCDSLNRSHFFCISKSCSQSSNAIICLNQECKTCSKINRHCKKNRLILVQSLTEQLAKKILPQTQYVLNKKNVIIQRYQQIIQRLSKDLQDFKTNCDFFNCAKNQRKFIENIIGGQNFQTITHRSIRQIRQNIQHQTFYEISKACKNLQNYLFYPMDKALQTYRASSKLNFTIIPSNKKCQQYDLRSQPISSTSNAIKYIDPNAIKLKLNNSLSLKENAEIKFKKLKILQIEKIHQESLQAIADMFPNLQQIKVKQIKSKLVFQELIRLPNVKKICLKNDIQKSLEEKLFEQNFTLEENNNNKYYNRWQYDKPNFIFRKFKYWEFTMSFHSTEIINPLRNIKHLNLSSNDQIKNAEKMNLLLKNAQLIQHLQSLCLQKIIFQKRNIEFLNKLKSLKKIYLIYCEGLTQDFLNEITFGVKHIQQFTLKLNIKSRQSDLTFIFMKNLKNLKQLDLDIQKQTSSYFTQMRLQQNREQVFIDPSFISSSLNLTILSLKIYSMLPSWIQEASKLKKLTSFYLTLNSKEGYWSQAIKKLSKKKTLKTFFLSSQKKTHITMKILSELSSNIQNLSVKGLQITEQEIAILAKRFKKLKILSIYLKDVQKWNISIIQTIKKFRNLTSLYLKNQIKINQNIEILQELSNYDIKVSFNSLNWNFHQEELKQKQLILKQKKLENQKKCINPQQILLYSLDKQYQ